MQFGRLTVLERADNAKDGSSRWLCQCNCEEHNTVIVSGRNLNSGHTKSCGCIRKEITQNLRPFNKYDLDSKEYGIGYTNKGEEFYFDKEDYNKIKEYTWYIDGSRCVCTKPPSGLILFHRLVTNADKDMEVDHINHIRTDNRKCNLRVVDRSLNQRNLPLSKRNTSGVVGVWFNKDANKWVAEIRLNYKKISLGYFINKEDAIKARKEAEEKYFGEYSYDNSMKIAKENGIIENKD